MSHDSNGYEPWPAFSYEEFKPTAYLLHMCIQAVGKLKLIAPFGPHWDNVPLTLTSRGLTTGPIPYGSEVFSVDIDLINHEIICTTSVGKIGKFKLGSTSVSLLTETLLKTLKNIGVNVTINLKPQEIPDPIPFDKDTTPRSYDPKVVNTWWRILMRTHRVMEQYHAHFIGRTPPVGVMWGTLDLRDVRYNGTPVSTAGMKLGYIRCNAMDEAQIEVGWWGGNEIYPRPAFFSYTYPQPKDIEQTPIKPAAAKWNASLSEYILDYEDVRNAKDPDNYLLQFFESAYDVGARLSGWKPELVKSAKPL